MDLNVRTSVGARVTNGGNRRRLSIPAGEGRRYRLAQIDDCTGVARREFQYHTLNMHLRARVSSESIQGTWGFGAWNDPYRIHGGPGETIFQALTFPNAAWFFSSSSRSHLSFRDDRPGNGFLAQVFKAEPVRLPSLVTLAATFILSRKATRRKLNELVQEDEIRLEHDVTQWHEYGLNWNARGVVFQVDGQMVMDTPISPRGPLAVVIWIDNQFAAFTPQGRIAAGALGGPEEWMEIEDLLLEG